MTAELRQAIAEAEGAGELQGPGVVHGRAEHPVCGDVVEVTYRIDGGRLADLAWRASGCPATLAVAAVARRALCGAPLAELPHRLRARLCELGDLAAHERHAEKLLLRALEMPDARGPGAAR